jgi:hypothetical protein
MKTACKQNLIAAALVCALALTTAVAQAADLLPSWNDSNAKQSIIAFVEKVTKPGSPDFVPMPERIATFDTDAARKYAYDANAKSGRLVEALKEAPQRGWSVVDIKNDWKRIFAFEQ